MTNGSPKAALILSIEQRVLWLKALRFSKNIEEVDQAVYDDDPQVANYVVWNPLLTEKHIRHLYPKMNYSLHRVFLIQNPSFPTDLLHEISLTVDPSYEGEYIKSHPNATDEIKSIVTLRLLGEGC